MWGLLEDVPAPERNLAETVAPDLVRPLHPWLASPIPAKNLATECGINFNSYALLAILCAVPPFLNNPPQLLWLQQDSAINPDRKQSPTSDEFSDGPT
jgi:hypothetical protein